MDWNITGKNPHDQLLSLIACVGVCVQWFVCFTLMLCVGNIAAVKTINKTIYIYKKVLHHFAELATWGLELLEMDRTEFAILFGKPELATPAVIPEEKKTTQVSETIREQYERFRFYIDDVVIPLRELEQLLENSESEPKSETEAEP